MRKCIKMYLLNYKNNQKRVNRKENVISLFNIDMNEIDRNTQVRYLSDSDVGGSTWYK